MAAVGVLGQVTAGAMEADMPGPTGAGVMALVFAFRLVGAIRLAERWLW